MKLLSFFFIVLLVASTAVFSSNLEQEKTLTELSVRLEKINQDLIVANQKQMQLSAKINGASRMQAEKLLDADKIYAQNMQSIFNSIINKMQALQKQYKNNPYIKIIGFSINIGIPPSVTVSLEFTAQ